MMHAPHSIATIPKIFMVLLRLSLKTLEILPFGWWWVRNEILYYEPHSMFVPPGKASHPLGRESVFGRSLPRVYALTVCALHIMKDRGIRASSLCYSNISSDPWQIGGSWTSQGLRYWGMIVEGWQMMVDRCLGVGAFILSVNYV